MHELDAVEGAASIEIEGTLDGTILFEIRHGQESVFHKEVLIDSNETPAVEFTIQSPRLWYPHGYGEQELYHFSCSVVSTEQDSFIVTKRVGFRKTELLQHPDDNGESFYFRVNGRDIFCGGSNWIPADNFTPRISADRYRCWLQTTIDGNQVMVRYALKL
jgi:beta-mannosidase